MRAVLTLAFALWVSAAYSSGQSPSLDNNSSLPLWQLEPSPESIAPAPVGRTPHIRLFRIAPGFLSDPIGLQDDDNTLPGVPANPSSMLGQAPPSSPTDRIQFGMGADNPYLDLRRPGDPGGIGFYRVNTQVQLLDSPTTACTLGFQAVTPAGIQFAGAPDGATVVSPTFSIFHALNESFAVQGFVAKNVAVSNADGSTPLQRNVQYGVALQRPLVADGPESLRNLFLSVGAMGQIRPERDNLKLLPLWDVLPGLQWHVNDNWWMSSGLLLPIGPARTAPGQWQLTCSFQF